MKRLVDALEANKANLGTHSCSMLAVMYRLQCALREDVRENVRLLENWAKMVQLKGAASHDDGR